MLPFALEPATTDDPVRGLIVHGSKRPQLHEKLLARADHYGGLAIATGDDWTAVLISENTDIALPWLADPPVFLYALRPMVYCQMQHRPNVPKQFWPNMVATLRKQADLPTAFAMTTTQIYDLAQAEFMSDLAPDALI